MNWYKKIAMPLKETDPNAHNYLQIAHEGDSFLWIIQKDWKFYKVPISEVETHGQWEQNRPGNETIATGRYFDGKASLALSYKLRISPFVDKIINKVVKMLDQELDNPEIINFSMDNV